MKLEVFIFVPGKGNYGTDWVNAGIVNSKAESEIRIAYFEAGGYEVRVFSCAKAGVMKYETTKC